MSIKRSQFDTAEELQAFITGNQLVKPNVQMGGLYVDHEVPDEEVATDESADAKAKAEADAKAKAEADAKAKAEADAKAKAEADAKAKAEADAKAKAKAEADAKAAADKAAAKV